MEHNYTVGVILFLNKTQPSKSMANRFTDTSIVSYAQKERYDKTAKYSSHKCLFIIINKSIIIILILIITNTCNELGISTLHKSHHYLQFYAVILILPPFRR